MNTCTYVNVSNARRTLTVSEEAYDALARLKLKSESFTKLILRLARKRERINCLDYMRSISPDHDLADRLEKVLEERKRIPMKSPALVKGKDKGLLKVTLDELEEAQERLVTTDRR